MRRIASVPRGDLRANLERLGLTWHTAGGVPYWDESAQWVFTPGEIDLLEAATNELHARCLDAVEHVISANRFAQLRIPEGAADLVRTSWNDDPPSIYGRFDLAWRGTGEPKLLEYNADTPTALIEAAVAQWEWLTACVPGGDQWNSLHERLVAAWKSFAPKLDNRLVHFVSMETPEDLATVTYLQDCAEQAGLRTRFLPVSRIGWDHARRAFVDEEGDSLATCFKLYPWEWMVREEFAARLATQPAYGPPTQWIEPAWKMVLSNKGLLPILWELFPGHPNLLEAHFAAGKMKSYVQKPLLSREGANIRLVLDGVEVARGVDDGYGKEGFIEQALTPEAVVFDGKWPVLGCWVVQGEAAGMGVREADTMITGPGSRFVPHRMG